MATHHSGTRGVLCAILAGLLVPGALPARAASPETEGSAYNNTRYLDDFTWMADPAKAGDPQRPTDFWDGVKYLRLGDDTYGLGSVTVSVLAMRPVQDKIGAFADATNMRQALWGTYATIPLLPGLSADLYWLGYDNTRGTFRGKYGFEQRQTFGTRVFGGRDGWDWNQEAVYQVGNFIDHDIRAWMVASIVGYTFRGITFEPRVALEGNASSGDNPRSATIGTFNALFPRLPYFAETSLPVPANVYDVRPVLTFRPLPDVTVVAGWDTLWRASTRDALYGSGMVPYPGTAKATSNRVGDETSVDVRWRPTPHLTFGAIYAYLAAAPAITQAHGRSVD